MMAAQRGGSISSFDGFNLTANLRRRLMMGEMKEWVCGEIIAKGGEHKRGWVSFKWKGWRFYKKKKT